MDDLDKLREKLKIFMASYDLTIQDIARRIKRDQRTIWLFLHKVGNPNSRTEYRIRELIGEVKTDAPI